MKGYHDTRLPFDHRRDVLWKTLCEHFFQRMIPPCACVLELGTGYAHFINHIHAARRIAIDQWEGSADYVSPGVEIHLGSVTALEFLPDNSVDFAFASNLFEHLTKEEFATVLKQLRTKLRGGGTLNILQPNYRFAQREYFDDYSHITVYTDRSMCDFLATNGFLIKECKARFLPLTIKSRLPVHPFLIRMYLSLPFKPMGQQMFVRASVDA